jgi:hypothetical protein
MNGDGHQLARHWMSRSLAPEIPCCSRSWPLDRSFDVFCRWSDFQHHSMLVDLCDGPLTDESD